MIELERIIESQRDRDCERKRDGDGDICRYERFQPLSMSKNILLLTMTSALKSYSQVRAPHLDTILSMCLVRLPNPPKLKGD